MRTFAIIIGLLAVSLSGCNTQHSNEGSRVRSAVELKPVAKRNPAPNFRLKDADGKELSLADLRGKVVLLNFWATWCGPCKMEIPWFIEFQKEFKDKGFEVVGLSMDDDGWRVVKPFLEAKQINYRVAIADEQAAQSYGGVDSLPTTFLIDRAGKIAQMHVGLAGKNEYRDEIAALVEDSQSATR
jgi:peroxiredoxin